jgi:hypothetical protein
MRSGFPAVGGFGGVLARGFLDRSPSCSPVLNMKKRTSIPAPGDRTLLTMTTGEPFQPVRLYYTVPDRSFVTQRLRTLRCVAKDAKHSWLWLYEAEATSLVFGPVSHAELPRHGPPVIIGKLRVPAAKRMTIELRSFERAIRAATFFAPVLGPRVALRRCRVVNRWFHAQEMQNGLEELDRQLDRDVTLIDPVQVERRLDELLAGARTRRERTDALARFNEERRARDIPLIEDFPLAREEERPDFFHLRMTLQFRLMRAFEHWNGNTHQTLADIIERYARQVAADLGS